MDSIHWILVLFLPERPNLCVEYIFLILQVVISAVIVRYIVRSVLYLSFSASDPDEKKNNVFDGMYEKHRHPSTITFNANVIKVFYFVF